MTKDWSLAKATRAESLYPCQWEWWSKTDMEDAIASTLTEDVNFRNIPVWKKYASQKRIGDWAASPQPIVLNRGGRILDGLNRLRSDVDADVSGRWYLTVRNWSEDDDSGIDRGKARNSAQWFRRHFNEMQLGNQDIATVRWSIRGGVPFTIIGAPSISPEILLEAIRSNEPAFARVLGSTKVKGFIAPMRAAFVRAHGLIPDLDEAFQFILTGERPDHISSERASPLTALLRVIRGPIMSGMQSDVLNYQKAASALHLWGANKPASKLYGTAKELLPVKSLDSIWKRLTEQEAANESVRSSKSA